MWPIFKDRHAKSVRALKTSLDKEAILVSNLRRLKDQIVQTSAQLRVALHQKALDDRTIDQLRNQAQRAIVEASLAKAKEKQAKDMLHKLKAQVDHLQAIMNDQKQQQHKKTPKTVVLPRDDQDQLSSNTKKFTKQASPYRLPPPLVVVGKADDDDDDEEEEEEETLDARSRALLDYESSPVLKKLTPFQRWKKKHHILTPNTPTASDAFVLPDHHRRPHNLRDPFGDTLRKR